MTLTAYVFLIAISMVLIAPFIPVLKDAYAHGISSGGPGGRPLVVKYELFSDNTIGTNDVLVIKGTLESRFSRDAELSPYVSVEPAFGCFGFRPCFYPLYNDPASWYFKTEYNTSTPIVLKGGEELNYEIKVQPLKAGTYHLHSMFVSDDRSYFSHQLPHYAAIGRGQTVVVTGSVAPTAGEITQLYVPLAIGGAVLAFLIIRAWKMVKKADSGKVRKGVRFYFAAKASIETVWLSGTVIWLASAAYPVLYPLETRLFHVLGMIAVIAAIAAGSHVSAIAKPRLQRMSAVATAGASFAFYFLLPVYIDDGGFGYTSAQFDIDYLIMSVAMIVNAAVLILALMPRKEVNKTRMVESGVPH